jgi:hypothetical protein
MLRVYLSLTRLVENAAESSKMSDKDTWGIVSLVLTIIAFAPYFRSIFKGETKPHMFTWFVGGSCHAVNFIGTYIRGAGAGSWSSGFTALICFAIAVLSFSRGEKNITKSDWVAFIFALAIIPVWYLTKDPLGAVILALLINYLGCYPTARKSYKAPHSENIFTWIVGALRYLISIFAVEQYSIVTVVYTLGMFFANSVIIALLVWRRRAQLRPKSG